MGSIETHTLITRYLSIWLFPCLLVFGIAGNFLCLLVILKRSPFPADVRGWFAMLSLVNLFILIFSGTDFYLVTSWDVYLSNGSPALCKLLNVINYTGPSLACWIQTGISLLRACSTLNTSSIRGGVLEITRLRSYLGLTVVIATNFIVYIPICMATIQFVRKPATQHFDTLDDDAAANTSATTLALVTSFHSSNNSGTFVSTHNSKSAAAAHRCYTEDASLHLIDIVLKDSLPLLIMITCSILVLIGLRRVNLHFRMNLQQRMITLTLFAMNLAYFFFQLPYNIFSILVTRIVISEEKYLVVAQLLISLSYLHFAGNWLFFLLSARFRKYIRVTVYLCMRTRKKHQDIRMKMLI